MSTGVLERIVAAKRADLAREQEHVPLRRVVELATAAPCPADFAAVLRRPGSWNVIAEIKRASPSRGGIHVDADVPSVARAYAAAGAAALSVLTERRFFLGTAEDLTAAKEAVRLPVLRKDFILEPYQVYQSLALGADSLLLIARILEARALVGLLGVARSLHMEPVVEVHTEDEVKKALDCGAAILGVNNRDLATLGVSIAASLSLAPLLPESVVKVSESGIESRGDLERLRAAGYDAFLIGERLMREPDPGAALRLLLEGAP